MLTCCIKSFCDLTAEVICYAENLRKIINGFVSLIKQKQSFSHCSVMPQQTKETKPYWPSYIMLNTGMSGYAQLLLLCYSCKTVQHHMEDITHPKPALSFSELSPNIISFCSLPSCKYCIKLFL